MFRLNHFAFGEIGDGAGDLQYARIGAVGQLQAFAGEQQNLFCIGGHFAGFVDVARGELGVDADARGIIFISVQLHLTGARYARADHGAGFFFALCGKSLRRDGFDLDVHIDSIQQRPRYAA